MASFDYIERADLPEPVPPTTSIWGDVEQHGHQIKRKRVSVCLGISILCGAVLALVLFFGLPEPSKGGEDAGQIAAQQQSSSNITEQTDHNALGCFKDSVTDRSLLLEFADAESMTPDVSDIVFTQFVSRIRSVA